MTSNRENVSVFVYRVSSQGKTSTTAGFQYVCASVVSKTHFLNHTSPDSVPTIQACSYIRLIYYLITRAAKQTKSIWRFYWEEALHGENVVMYEWTYFVLLSYNWHIFTLHYTEKTHIEDMYKLKLNLKHIIFLICLGYVQKALLMVLNTCFYL